MLKDVSVSVGTRAILHPQLALGRVGETVSVTAETPLIDTAQSSLGAVVSEQSIESLPLNGRNFTDFALLTAGATTDGDFGMISFNGVSGNYNNYTVDGGNNNNAFSLSRLAGQASPISSRRCNSRIPGHKYWFRSRVWPVWWWPCEYRHQNRDKSGARRCLLLP